MVSPEKRVRRSLTCLLVSLGRPVFWRLTPPASSAQEMHIAPLETPKGYTTHSLQKSWPQRRQTSSQTAIGCLTQLATHR